jgi:hypothetical protein
MKEKKTICKNAIENIAFYGGNLFNQVVFYQNKLGREFCQKIFRKILFMWYIAFIKYMNTD